MRDLVREGMLHSGIRRVLGLEGGENLDEQGEGGRVSCNLTHLVLASDS